MKVVVTGGAGFIGSYVVKHLVSQGHEVTVADRFTYAGKAQHLMGVLNEVSLLYGDGDWRAGGTDCGHAPRLDRAYLMEL